MLRLLADENFNNAIVRGLRLREPTLDVVTVQEVGLGEADDPDVLEWAAGEGRIVLTHDVKTMPGFAYERVTAGLPMPGMFAMSGKIGIGLAVEQILILAGASLEGEWADQVVHVPL